jgi:CheY-like chemotaxis protein
MSTQRFRALVADDDPETLQMVAEAVDRFGADVTCAATGGELIEQLPEARFDLVITDVSMPWMTGLQAMHSARTAGLSTPIVVMTALRDHKIVEQVRALGHDAILLQKPFGIDELYAAMRSVLGDAVAPASEQRGA